MTTHLRAPASSARTSGLVTDSDSHAVHEIARSWEAYLPSRLIRPGYSSLFALLMQANWQPQLHSSARHCHRLPSSLLIENASGRQWPAHSVWLRGPAPKHFRSRLTTSRQGGSRDPGAFAGTDRDLGSGPLGSVVSPGLQKRETGHSHSGLERSQGCGASRKLSPAYHRWP